ncbi:MAG: FUSC family protein [Nitrososphaeria archaeon]|nr:FUSC family protein [Nitrososphaeria archaeon]
MSSKTEIGYVLKLLFKGYKNIYMFYVSLIIVLIFVSLTVFFDNQLANLFELSMRNPLGILSSIFMQNSFSSLIVNIFSVILLILTFTSLNSILEVYNFKLKYDLSKSFMFFPLLSSIITNITTYAILLFYNFSEVVLSGFHVLVQPLLGFSISLTLFMLLLFEGRRKFFLPLSLTLLGFLVLYILYGIYFFGLSSFIFDFQKFFSLSLGLLSGIVISVLKLK